MIDLSSEKVKVCLSVSRKLFQQYRQFLAEKFGEMRKGLISSEIENAIAVYMAEHERHTHTEQKHEIKSPNPTPRVQKVRESIKSYLQFEFGYDVIYQVPLTQVKQAIAMTRGTDERTIRKWLDTFEEYYLMRYVGANMVEFL